MPGRYTPSQICMFIIFTANHMPSPHNLLFFSPPPWRVTCYSIIHITFFFSYTHITGARANPDKSKHYQFWHTLGQVESNSYTNTLRLCRRSTRITIAQIIKFSVTCNLINHLQIKSKSINK